MKRKKIILLLLFLSVAIVLNLSGCGESAVQSSQTENSSQVIQSSELEESNSFNESESDIESSSAPETSKPDQIRQPENISEGFTDTKDCPPYNTQQLLLRFAEDCLFDDLNFSQTYFAPPMEARGYQSAVDDLIDIRIYQYNSPSDASNIIEQISEDGYAFTSIQDSKLVETRMAWKDQPHFYKCFSMIVLYCGNDHDIIEKLTKILGSQSAGQTKQERELSPSPACG